MKINRLLAAPVAAAVLLGTSSAFAQPAPLNAPMIAQPVAPAAPRAKAPLDDANWRAILVQNVPPSMIAYQLDQQHNKLPAFFNVPPLPMAKARVELPQKAPDEKRVKGPFDLPDNVRLVAADEQNLLFVTGADNAQIAQLQELVDILDQPLRQVEIEAQVVELSVEEMNKFGMDFSAARGNFDTSTRGALTQPVPGKFQIGFVRNNFQTRLNALANSNKAKIASIKPLTLVNNSGMAVSLRSGPIDNTGANQNKPYVAPAQGSDTILQFTPTINGDDTITVLMGTTTLPANANSRGLVTIFTLRDGDTIALGGSRTPLIPTEPKPLTLQGDIPFIGELFRKKNSEGERETVIFITARIAR